MKRHTTGWYGAQEFAELAGVTVRTLHQERVSKQWAELFADIEASLSEDPAGKKAQALAARWKKLVEGFTGGDPEIRKGLNAMWADRANWPEGPQQNRQIRPEVQEFIMKAMKYGS